MSGFGNQGSYGEEDEEKLQKELIIKQKKYSKEEENKLQNEIEGKPEKDKSGNK